MILLLVVVFGVSMLTAYAIPNMEADNGSVAPIEVQRQVTNLQRAFDAARREVDATPTTTGRAMGESEYKGEYPPGYAGHGGTITVWADGENITAYTNDPPIAGAVHLIGETTNCSALAGKSVAKSGGDIHLRSSCSGNEDGKLPPAASVTPGRLVMTGAL